METYDVAVAGGGPAGLSAARTAAAAGARVVVLERESAFGIPTRTSGGSFIADLQRLGVPSTLYNPIRLVHFLGPTRAAHASYDEPVVAILDVRALYQWLAERAAAAGADLRLRSTVMSATDHGDAVELAVRGAGGERRVRSRYAVDATGTAAVLAGAVGMHPPYRRRAVGAELDLAAPHFPVDECHLIVGCEIAPAGYAWVFPYRPGRVRLGVGVIQPDSDADPRPLLDRVRALPALRDALAESQPVEVHAGLIPVEPLRTTIVRGSVVCAGDSASHASTLVGEGIRYAMRAGEGAGAAVGEALRRGDASPLHDFERRWRREHGRDFAIAYRVNRVLASFDDARWDRAAESLAHTPPWFLAAALSTRFRVRDLLRLAGEHPTLALRFARAATGR